MKILYLFVFASFLVSCHSVPKLLEKGMTDKAYAVALRKAERSNRTGKPLKPKSASEFVAAYAAVQRQQLDLARYLENEAGTDKYPQLYATYAKLYDRSINLLDFLPDSADFSANPELAPASLEQKRETSRREAGALYLRKIDQLREPALAGDKSAARKAWGFYQPATYYLPEREPELLEDRADFRELGTLRIEVYAASASEYPEIVNGLNGSKAISRGWTEIYPHPVNKRIDLEAEVVYDRFKSSGPTEECSTQHYSERVVDRIEKKKVRQKVNDSTWVEKIVEVKHYKEVWGQVTECEQSMMVCALGFVRVYAPGQEALRWESNITGVQRWSNDYSYSSGDPRALPAGCDSGSRSYPPSFDVLFSGALYRLPGLALSRLSREYAPRLSSGQRRALRAERERWSR